jgi:hypothetical protein
MRSKVGVAGSRVRWLFTFPVVPLISSVVQVIGEEPAKVSSEPAGFTPPASKEEEVAATQVADASEIANAIGEAEREEVEQEGWLATPEAKEQREDSWLAFGDLSAGELRLKQIQQRLPKRRVHQAERGVDVAVDSDRYRLVGLDGMRHMGCHTTRNIVNSFRFGYVWGCKTKRLGLGWGKSNPPDRKTPVLGKRLQSVGVEMSSKASRSTVGQTNRRSSLVEHSRYAFRQGSMRGENNELRE